MNMKRIIAAVIGVGFLSLAGVSFYVYSLTRDLPKLITVEDYTPLLVTEVFDRNQKKIGEFFRQKRLIAKHDEIPQLLKNAFIAAEDDSFYEHNGINYRAIMRAVLANIKAGRKAQGASTITQQVARSLLLTSEKTYSRKIKEVFLAWRMEENLSKEDILFLYLNQIYLGQGAYGIKMASQVYFRKNLADLTIPEAALLAGLPQAPSRYSPIRRPELAKNRQVYVIRRMQENGFITEAEAEESIKQPLKVFELKDFDKYAAYYLETVRQMLVDELGSDKVLNEGLRVHTSLDLDKQIEAYNQVRDGLRQLDKRQGYRGAEKNLTDQKDIEAFLLQVRNQLIDEASPERILQPDGTLPDPGPLNLNPLDENGEPRPNLPDYVQLGQIIKGVVIQVDDTWGLVRVRFAESQGLIDIEDMKWAREPNPNVAYSLAEIEKPSQALKVGDVIDIRVVGKRFYSSRLNKELRELRSRKGKDYERPEEIPDFEVHANLELEQEPQVQGALLSFDQRTQDIIAMVGGYDFSESKYNRAFQAIRQSGSSFKALVYAAALDKGYTPATPIVDAPIVYEEEQQEEGQTTDFDEEALKAKKWKPSNYTRRFSGDILFRNALIRSLNVPTIKVIQDISVDTVATYARRLGVFSPLNMDFTLALGSSGVTLYEMTKMFSQFGRMGKRITPMLIHKVEDADGNVLMEEVGLDARFKDELEALAKEFEDRRQNYLRYQRRLEAGEELEAIEADENARYTAMLENLEPGETPPAPFKFKQEPPLYFKDRNQLMKPQTAYVITSLLQGVVEEQGGTGGRARTLGRPVAGKTGTTSDYFDAWFVGYTTDIATGVWVGFDHEKTLGRGEGGGRAALPIWVDYMKAAHDGAPTRSFPVPDDIVFANIDNKTGKLASASSENVVRQAFISGSEPQSTPATETEETDIEQDFYKQDLSD